MADDVLPRIQMEGHAQPGGELHQPVIGDGGKLPRLVGVADLDGHRVVVAGVGGVGDLRQGDALDHLSLQSHDKVTGGVNAVGPLRQGLEVIAVGLGGGAGIAYVVDHHAIDLLQRGSGTGELVDGEVVLFHIVRHGDILPGKAPGGQPPHHRQNQNAQHRQQHQLSPAGAPPPAAAAGMVCLCDHFRAAPSVTRVPAGAPEKFRVLREMACTLGVSEDAAV